MRGTYFVGSAPGWLSYLYFFPSDKADLYLMNWINEAHPCVYVLPVAHAGVNVLMLLNPLKAGCSTEISVVTWSNIFQWLLPKLRLHFLAQKIIALLSFTHFYCTNLSESDHWHESITHQLQNIIHVLLKTFPFQLFNILPQGSTKMYSPLWSTALLWLILNVCHVHSYHSWQVKGPHTTETGHTVWLDH